MIGKKEREYGTYIIPGLKATRTLLTSEGDMPAMCTTMTPQGLAVTEDYVFIHDGARPYVTKQSIDDLVECLKTYDAGLLMVPCKDTIKEVKEGIVVKTLKRENFDAGSNTTSI